VYKSYLNVLNFSLCTVASPFAVAHFSPQMVFLFSSGRVCSLAGAGFQFAFNRIEIKRWKRNRQRPFPQETRKSDRERWWMVGRGFSENVNKLRPAEIIICGMKNYAPQARPSLW